jgi:hypothetical protein
MLNADAMNDIWADIREPVNNTIDAIIRHLPQGSHNDCPTVPYANVDGITEVVMTVIAELVVGYIDAGSERDAVMENERLYNAIRDELIGWSDNEEEANKVAQRP